MRIVLALFLTLFCLGLPQDGILAQTSQPPPEPPKFSTRVKLKVSAPEPVRNAIATLISKELESLGDVIITDRNSNYNFTIMVIPNITEEERFGYTLSVLITRPLDINILRPLLLSDKLDEKEKGLLIFLSSRYELIEKQALRTSSNEDIPKTCHEIVRGFNEDLIAKDRKLWQTLWAPLSKIPEDALMQQHPE
jgi:hypothetical protein